MKVVLLAGGFGSRISAAVKKHTNEKKDTMEKARTKDFDPLKLNEK